MATPTAFAWNVDAKPFRSTYHGLRLLWAVIERGELSRNRAGVGAFEAVTSYKKMEKTVKKPKKKYKRRSRASKAKRAYRNAIRNVSKTLGLDVKSILESLNAAVNHVNVVHGVVRNMVDDKRQRDLEIRKLEEESLLREARRRIHLWWVLVAKQCRAAQMVRGGNVVTRSLVGSSIEVEGYRQIYSDFELALPQHLHMLHEVVGESVLLGIGRSKIHSTTASLWKMFWAVYDALVEWSFVPVMDNWEDNAEFRLSTTHYDVKVRDVPKTVALNARARLMKMAGK